MTRRKGERGEMPLWMPVFMVTAALALAVVLMSMLRHDDISTDTAADRAFRSALLPDGWETYTGNVWSVGYPGEWDYTATDEFMEGGPTNSFIFVPDFSNGSTATDYLTVTQYDNQTIDALLVQNAVPVDAERAEFLFAGYPAMKVTSGDVVTHYVQYGDQVYVIATKHYDDAEVGIMLATFQFNVKE